MDRMKKVRVAALSSLLILSVTLAYAGLTQLYTGTSPPYHYNPGQVIGHIETNTDNGATWSTNNITYGGTSPAWYMSFITTSIGYVGQVKANWTMFWSQDALNWNVVSGAAVQTAVNTTGASGQRFYASSDGTQALNTNWAGWFTINGPGYYHVNVQIDAV